ncbi:MAG TPA: hypothetical protein DCM02_10360 [Flavobacterium sp.]|nr:hypothetical protein [Flavobacterium sp.]HAT76378.1 hypothetical protein [Flavobacterium sp.]
MKVLFSFFCLLFCFNGFSQAQNNQEKIAQSIQTYFHYNRENIHVQFNKNRYVNNEDLAFKGYVYNKKNAAPFLNTTNVELVIYNEQQEIIQKQLLYTTNGTFTGGIRLNDTFKTGKYYFQFYTNWMNNFNEDESFIQTIEIINKNEPYQFNSTEPHWETAQVTFFPEGGNIISDINNTVGVRITDCNQKGIEIKDIIILDSKSNEVSRFKTNTMGNGLFNFIPDIKEKYTLKINSKEVTLSKTLPKVQETGIILTYNNKLNNNKIVVAIKTNEKGVELYQNKKFSLLVQQDANFIQAEIALKNNTLEKEIYIDKKYFSNGVNSIRLIDENLNEICERLIYNYATNRPITTLETKLIANDSIKLFGITESQKANLSISVLPEKNACVDQKRTIQGTFYLNAYLENPEINTFSYYDIENPNRIKEMDLLMLNQNHSKYLWENIKNKPPKTNYNFEKGVTISGKVDKEIKPNSKFRISLVSLKDNVFDETTIDKNNDFKFENFYVKDSTVFLFQMINEKNKVVTTNIEARVSRNSSRYLFPVLINKSNCPIKKNTDKSFVFTNPKRDDKTTYLKEVTIINNSKKNALTHEKEMSFNATAYKIEDNDFGSFLDFLTMHGYRTGVDDETNEVYIQSNRRSMVGEPNSPSIYLDNSIVTDLNFLFNLNLQDIDEIYIDQSGASDTAMGGYGTIKVFLKTGRGNNNYFKKTHTSLIIKKGFTKNIDFKPQEFESQNEFYFFGTLNWSPNIILKDKSSFEIIFPRGNQNEIQVLVEGFSDDGQLISEIKKIPVSTL